MTGIDGNRIKKEPTVDDWNRWKQNKERSHIESEIEALTGEETLYNTYAPMTAKSD
jgi:hypothetical protein